MERPFFILFMNPFASSRSSSVPLAVAGTLVIGLSVMRGAERPSDAVSSQTPNPSGLQEKSGADGDETPECSEPEAAENGETSAEEGRVSCRELVEAAGRLCEELNDLNRRIYDISAARASAMGQEFRGVPLSDEEKRIMEELKAAQHALAGEAQDMAHFLSAVEEAIEAGGCEFKSCYQKNLDPSVESAPHYISRENTAAVYHVQVAPWRPVKK